MHISPRKRLLKRLMAYSFSSIRQYMNLENEEFDQKMVDFPNVLRQMAKDFEDPPSDLAVSELPGFQGYSLWADSYDSETDNRVIKGEQGIIWDLIDRVRIDSVLDVGCGTGRHAIPLAQRGASVTATEPTLERLVGEHRLLLIRRDTMYQTIYICPLITLVPWVNLV